MDLKRVESLIKEIDPWVVIPSCYAVDGMKGMYSSLKPLDDFLKMLGLSDVPHEKKLKLQPSSTAEDAQYKVVVLERRKS